MLQAGRLIVGIFCVLTLASSGWAAFGEDTEKPKPEFARQGEGVVAKLIPRGKSTSVLIEFRRAGRGSGPVEAEDFDEAGQAGMDAKDFRSALFAVKADGVSPGGEITLSLASNYFTQATELWALNRGLQTPWMKADAVPIERPDRVQELVLTVKDGGPLDSDGAVNGEILLVVGPKDSFWGYALGTLLIRFFGVFLVLGVLMVGMIAAGLIFQTAGPSGGGFETGTGPAAGRRRAERGLRRRRTGNGHGHRGGAAPAPVRPEDGGVINLERSDGSSWSRQGRSQIMRDRLLVHDRPGRK